MPKPITVPSLAAMKAEGRKITMLTAYDYPTAKLVDAAGVDAVLVGDSLAMVVQGRENTLPVTLDQMIYHAEMVGRAVERALVVVDLPFPTPHLDRARVVEDAARVLKETRCQAVKLEGGAAQADAIAALAAAGIPVMGHVGLGPQRVHQLGGYRVQRDRRQLLADAQAVEHAGAFGVVLECVPSDVAAAITKKLSIPTIGIGAGPACDGQVLVINDVLGATAGRSPKFVKAYADLRGEITRAAEQFCGEVREGGFPKPEHGYD
ncbi:MAG: 3-methyl-2-oxobutanoate hydroxymethyltransferase [Planctomycetota bacterium]